MIKSLFLGLLFCAFSFSAVAQDCPRIFQRGDTLYTDPAPQYQWFRDQNPIPNATKQWYLPPSKGNFSVTVSATTFPFPYFPQTSQKSITGRIIDERYEPIADATITFGKISVKSDAQGWFSLKNITVSGENAVVTITKAGFWKNVQRVHFFDQSEAPLTAMLEPLKVTNRFDATKGATISERGFFLTFPPNAVINESGQTYQGTVNLSLKRSFPSEDGFGLRMPGGDFSAIDQNGQEKILISYGFMSAEMQGANGEKLRLAPNQAATLEFYIPWEQNKTAPDSMPLWHFDETAGTWRPEGTARKVGPRYVGTVKHFSSWNCDYPGNRGRCRGRVRNCKGKTVPYIAVNVGQRVVTTDADGSYVTFVPSDTEFDVTANVDTVSVTPLVEYEEREVKDLEGSAILDAVGLIDSTWTLTVYGLGVESYSIDSGKSFHPKTETLKFGEGHYPTTAIARDSEGCEANFSLFPIAKQGDCQLQDYSKLKGPGMVFSVSGALASQRTVYKIRVENWENGDFNILATWFPCLQWLELYNKRLDRIPEAFFQYSNMQMLNLQGNNIGVLPESFGTFLHLKELYLSGNELTGLPESFTQLSQLQTLRLSGNQLTVLPESFTQLSQLQTLELGYNQFTDVPTPIKSLSNVKWLSMDYNQITAVPEFIGQFPKLTGLNLNGNQIAQLPESIGELTNLQQLQLSNNRLTELPQSIGQLTNLGSLSLSGNALTSLPRTIGQLSNLYYELDINGNQLIELPEEIGLLKELRGLVANTNQLIRLPESFGQLENLINLDLSNNQLVLLPKNFGGLVNLNTLNISSNKISVLPDSIIRLTKLQKLIANANQLTRLPEGIGELFNLEEINLKGNQLASIPKSIGLLNKLHTLNLSGNQLTLLPLEFSQLKNVLKTLNLSGNPIPEEEKAKIRSWLPFTTITF